MTDAYRQKLLDWLTSVLVVSLVTALCLVAVWFVVRPWELAGWRDEPPTMLHFWEYAGLIAESLVIFAILLVPTMIWHLFDIIQRGTPQGAFAARLSSVRTWWIVMSLLGGTIVLDASRLFSYTASCYGSFVFLSQGCYYTKGVLTIPMTILLLFIPILCMGKVVISIRSLIKKAP